VDSEAEQLEELQTRNVEVKHLVAITIKRCINIDLVRGFKLLRKLDSEGRNIILVFPELSELPLTA
jgi:hypothetical protein